MAKHTVLVLGAGKIGSLIACMFADSGDYEVHLGSLHLADAEQVARDLGLPDIIPLQLDASDTEALHACLAGRRFDAVVSSLPFYCNARVADIAADLSVNYFDLTEDVAVTEHIRRLSVGKRTVFMPQCGLAPGFISIAAEALIGHFEEVESVKMRVGALPVNPNNALKYSLTWSTDGLINEYGNTCYGLEGGQITALQPLEGFETISLDGVLYEAFNTSGGLGTLADTYQGRIKTMNYKTLRYPGHCKKIKLLMNDLKLNEDRPTLKRILENAIPKTKQDVVLVYVAVAGMRRGHYFEENVVKKVYPAQIAGQQWSSIQVTTAAGLCAVVDIVLHRPGEYHGFVRQEQIKLMEFLANRFGRYYDV